MHALLMNLEKHHCVLERIKIISQNSLRLTSDKIRQDCWFAGQTVFD